MPLSRSLFRVLACAGLVLGLASLATAQGKGDAALPAYKASPGVSGSIKSVGSDTMNNLMTLWGEGFRKYYPAVRIEIEGKGSGTAPPALTEGTATFGPMSREWKQDEIDGFEAKYGFKPTVLASSIDMVAVSVHKDNPIESLTLPQLDAIFSKTRKLGYPKDIETWGEAGLSDGFKDLPISLYGRNSASGTNVYFKEHVLGKGDFKPSVKEQPGSAAVVQAVGSDKAGIGYTGLGYITANVRTVPLAKKEGAKPVPAEAKYAYSGDYPLSRPLLISLNYKPKSTLDPLRREFLKYVYSKEGQAAVVKDGYLPVTPAMARAALTQVGVKPGF